MKYLPLFVLLGVLLVLCGLVAFGYSYVNATNNEGVIKENQLNAQYLDNQNELSAYISGFYEHVGIANAQTDAFDQVLTDAVKGRYDEGGFGGKTPLFAAILEAYPNADQLLKNWGKIQDYITAGREAYKNKQSKLLDMLQKYDAWRQTDFIKASVISALGYPRNLKAHIGENVFTGQAALDKMYQIVLTQKALDAYNSGKMAPLEAPTRNR